MEMQQYLWRGIEVVAENAPVGVGESSWRLFESNRQLIPCHTLEIDTAG